MQVKRTGEDTQMRLGELDAEFSRSDRLDPKGRFLLPMPEVDHLDGKPQLDREISLLETVRRRNALGYELQGSGCVVVVRSDV